MDEDEDEEEEEGGSDEEEDDDEVRNTPRVLSPPLPLNQINAHRPHILRTKKPSKR